MGFMDAGGKAVKFENVGDSFKGVVKRIEFDVDTTNLNGQQVKEDRIHLTDPEGDDRTLYVNKYLLGKAIREAVIASGKTTLDEGDELVVLHDGTQPSTKGAGFAPAKTFKAKVTAGVGQPVAAASAGSPAVSIDDI